MILLDFSQCTVPSYKYSRIIANNS